MTSLLRAASLLLLVTLAASLESCSRSTGAGTESSPRMIVGAGATLPYPLYSKWAAEYARVDPTVRVNYQSIGSGAGVRQVEAGVVDFGATDEQMSDEALRRGTTKLVQVPAAVGAVVLVFNLPGERELEVSGELAAEIFLGNVKRWDDERLRAANPGRKLPSDAIIVAHRADGSGTSAALTGYLSRQNEKWRTSVGTGTSVRFPVGIGARGNEGVTAFVRATPLSFGYVEHVYAKQARLTVAHITSGDADGQYPIAVVSWVVLPVEPRDRFKAEALAKFMWWAIHDGQTFARELEYTTLPAPLVARAEQSLRDLRIDGRPLLSAAQTAEAGP